MHTLTARRSYVLPILLVAGLLSLLIGWHVHYKIAQVKHAAAPATLSAKQAASLQVPFIESGNGSFMAHTFAGSVEASTGGIAYNFSIKTAKGTESALIKETLLHASPLALAGIGVSPTVVNIYKGNDPAKWKTHLSSYNEVSLGSPWQGIALSLIAHGNNVEKIFTLQPGADVSTIALSIAGAKSLSITKGGMLAIDTAQGEVSMTAPAAYQEVNGVRKNVDVQYSVSGLQYGFSVGSYDTTKPLVIDPLIASTLLGDTNFSTDVGLAVTTDDDGNIFVAGYTYGSTFPVTVTEGSGAAINGNSDAFVSKLSSDLTTLLVSTYLGGDGYDQAQGIASDDQGNIFVTGKTGSPDFPTGSPPLFNFDDTNGTSFDDVFLTFLGNNLTLKDGTFYGGPHGDYANGIAVNSVSSTQRDVFIAGYTNSANIPTTEGSYAENGVTDSEGIFQDAFVAKFLVDDSEGVQITLTDGTYLNAHQTRVNAIATDDSENVYIVGETHKNADLPFSGGAESGSTDGFVGKLASNLSTLTGSFLGGGNCECYGDDSAYALVIDKDGEGVAENIFVTGYTRATDFPGVITETSLDSDSAHDAYVAKLPASLSLGEVESTYVGGAGEENGYAIALDGSGSVLIAGDSNYNGDFPATEGAIDPNQENDEGFLAKFDPDSLAQEAMTFLGGLYGDNIYAMTIDSDGHVLVTGNTDSPTDWEYFSDEQPDPYNSFNFPITSGAYQHNADSDGGQVFITSLTSDLLGGCGDGFVSYEDNGEGGYVSGEECDDGNTVSGDGCSSTCTIETSYDCFGSPSACARKECYPGYSESYAYGDSCYVYDLNGEGSVPWENAETACESGTGHLVTIGSHQENNIVRKISRDEDGAQLWIGFSDSGEEGTFTWITDESVDYTAWGSGQPDDSDEGGQDCAIMNNFNYYQGTWDDLNCANHTDYVCEIPADCGDGILAGSEGCEDGNTTNGDGCSSSCGVESGYHCEGLPSVCSRICNSAASDANGFAVSGTKCFAIYTSESVVWGQASSTCGGLTDGSKLATIRSSAEQTALSDALDALDADDLWIGATDSDTEGSFVWVGDSDPFCIASEPGFCAPQDDAFDNWYEGEPNDSEGEDCVEILTDGLWNDGQCSAELNYICELANTLSSSSSSSSSPAESEESSSSEAPQGGGGHRGGGGGGGGGGFYRGGSASSAGHNSSSASSPKEKGPNQSLLDAINSCKDAPHPPAPQTQGGHVVGHSNQDGTILLHDVTGDAWYAAFVADLISKGIVSGYKDGKGNPTGIFAPGKPVSVAEIVKMAMMAFENPATSTSPVGNPEWKASWAAPYMARAEELNLPFASKGLKPNEPATRAVAIQILAEAAGVDISKIPDEALYNDVDTHDNHAPAIDKATKLCWIRGDNDTNGRPKGTFRPLSTINRAEVAKILSVILALR